LKSFVGAAYRPAQERFLDSNWTIKRRSRARPCLSRPDAIHIPFNDRLRALLRAYELRNAMDFESIVMLAVSVLMMVYLAYALLRPEKF
jgi:K+-transporting ATPase KdpF subunit